MGEVTCTLNLVWREACSYEAAKDGGAQGKAIYAYGWGNSCCYVGKLDKSSFGVRYNAGYEHWVRSCLANGARLFISDGIPPKLLENVELQLIQEWGPRFNKNRRLPAERIALAHSGDVPPFSSKGATEPPLQAQNGCATLPK